MSEDPRRAGAEAARLFAAAQEWLRGSAPHLAPVDDEGRTCSCPVCRGIVALREGDPESLGRWVDTAVAAVERVVAEVAAARPEPAPDPPAAPEADRHAESSADRVTPDPPQAAESERPRRVRAVPLDLPPDDAPASTTDPNAREE